MVVTVTTTTSKIDSHTKVFLLEGVTDLRKRPSCLYEGTGHMTYSAVYCALISKRLKNPITKDDCYVEKHHIIPKSEGGTDEPDNLVNLTAREHYIAHLLLAKIYDDHKMWCALALFRRWKNRQKRIRILRSVRSCFSTFLGRNTAGAALEKSPGTAFSSIERSGIVTFGRSAPA